MMSALVTGWTAALTLVAEGRLPEFQLPSITVRRMCTGETNHGLCKKKVIPTRAARFFQCVCRCSAKLVT